MQTDDPAVRFQREHAERQRLFDQTRRKNVETFERMWLSLGADVITAASSQHQAEVAEALGLVAGRWSRLLDAEAQIQRESANLASRPKKRPTSRVTTSSRQKSSGKWRRRLRMRPTGSAPRWMS
jgi:hypothetical protein